MKFLDASSSFDLSSLWDKVLGFFENYGMNILYGVAILVIGLWVIKLITRVVGKAIDRYEVDESLKRFLMSLTSAILKVMLILVVLQKFDVPVTSFIAILGAAGLAIGLALQGTLANFAGGVLVMLFRPYKIGDLIESQGVLGAVSDIQIFNTIMMTPENKTVIMPNGAIMNNHITNYSADGKIRVDTTVGISYGADMKKAKEVLLQALKDDPRVMSDPAPTVAISELADSSVNVVVRPWCDPAVYWDVYFDTVENAKIALDGAGIEIPFPQTDLHIVSDKTKS